MAKKLDSIVMITVLTSNQERRDQIDRAIDGMFASDERVQVIRVVGYPSTDEIADLSRKISDVTKEGVG